jgi:dienelactone hydrolase
MFFRDVLVSSLAEGAAMKMKLLLGAFIALIHGDLARAALQTKEITYTCKGVTLKGYLAWDDAATGKRPGVLVVHEWWGLNDYARKRAEELAKMGYVAFACDMYGEGKTTQHPKEAGQMATEVRKNVETWRARALAGLKILQDHEAVDTKKIAAIGYCFGGSTALQLAYSGADVSAVVSFHGALPVPEEDQVKNIKAKILICHGALDSFIPEKTIQQVRAALDNGKADYEMIYYGGAVHSFTVPDADKHGIKGMGYNREADRRSWMHMQMLFREVFGKAK